AGDIGDHPAAQRQPARDIGEIIGDRGGDALLGEQLEEAQAGVIMVVAGIGAGRKAARDDMRAVRCCFWHRVIPSVTGLSGSGRLGQLQASSPDVIRGSRCFFSWMTGSSPAMTLFEGPMCQPSMSRPSARRPV